MRGVRPLLACAGVLVALAAGCGEDEKRAAPAAPAPPVERIAVGSGAKAAFVYRARGTPPTAPLVVFLHGWLAVDPESYGPWLRHLAGNGANVVFPVYQKPPDVDTRTPLTNAIAGLRAALAKIGARPTAVVAAGHSAGGALAADYAGAAAAERLPAADVVYAVYPGRRIGGLEPTLVEIPGAEIPPATRILALASERDEVVGTQWARRIVATATRVPASGKELRLVLEPAVQDHVAPGRDDVVARRTFWAPLDVLLREAAMRPR